MANEHTLSFPRRIAGFVVGDGLTHAHAVAFGHGSSLDRELYFALRARPPSEDDFFWLHDLQRLWRGPSQSPPSFTAVMWSATEAGWPQIAQSGFSVSCRFRRSDQADVRYRGSDRYFDQL